MIQVNITKLVIFFLKRNYLVNELRRAFSSSDPLEIFLSQKRLAERSVNVSEKQSCENHNEPCNGGGEQKLNVLIARPGGQVYFLHVTRCVTNYGIVRICRG